MINIENQEIYAIYSTPKWITYKTQLPIDSTEEDILEFVCEDFEDVLRYFANYYKQKKQMKELLNFIPEKINDTHTFLSMCYVVDGYCRIIYPSTYKYEIEKMLKNNDLTYVSNTINYRQYKPKKKYKSYSYEFRKDPVPNTHKHTNLRSDYHLTRIFQNTFEIDREELDEMNINYYVPIRKKQEKEVKYNYGDIKLRHQDKCWKTSKKCKRQWQKHEKNCRNIKENKYD